MIRTTTHTARLTAPVHRRHDEFLRQQTILWNAALEERIAGYRLAGKTITGFDQCKSLTVIRSDDDEFSKFHALTQRSVLMRLDKAFKLFFKRVKKKQKPGFPRFKAKHRGIRSFDIPNPIIKTRGSGYALHVKGIGRFCFKTLPEGRIVAARVVKSALRVVVQFIVELPDQKGIQTDPVGIDMGVRHRAILSDGKTIERVNVDRRRLKRKQRCLSRAKKGSNSWRRKRVALQGEWERTRVREHNKLHQITTDLVKRNNDIAIEDLQIRNMVKNKTLARSITEQSWGKFADMLTYKAESAGGGVVRVTPRFTSMECSSCGMRRSLSLRDRTYCCVSCGYTDDRDINAAKNILKRGISLAGWEIGRSDRPGAPEDVLAHVAAVAGHGAEQSISMAETSFRLVRWIIPNRFICTAGCSGRFRKGC